MTIYLPKQGNKRLTYLTLYIPDAIILKYAGQWCVQLDKKQYFAINIKNNGRTQGVLSF